MSYKCKECGGTGWIETREVTYYQITQKRPDGGVDYYNQGLDANPPFVLFYYLQCAARKYRTLDEAVETMKRIMAHTGKTHYSIVPYIVEERVK